ncbi:MAG: family metallopeptidase [Clostridiaceae bacterium]|jgi:hypothetical protein|nr:family metallopeptidase [Clostridiaceae bacterium]
MKIYDGEYKVTSWFGPRLLANGDKRTHKGIDYVGLTSKNLLTVTDATVISSQIITDKSNLTWEYGNYIIFDDGYGYTFRYCHLSKRLVSKGDKVKKGQLVGVEGYTGYVYPPDVRGSHCHFEVRNSNNEPINPMDYFEILQAREEGIKIMAEIKRYKNIKDMPEWMQAYVKKWVEKGYIKGNDKGELDFSEDMIRVLIIAERMQGGK